MVKTPCKHFNKLRVKRIVKNVGNITIGAGGYKEMPITQITGYTCIAVNLCNYNNYSGLSTSGTGALALSQKSGSSYFVLGAPNAEITSLQVIFIYLSTEDFNISTTE